MRSGRTRWSFRRRTSGGRRASLRTTESVGCAAGSTRGAESGSAGAADNSVPANRKSRTLRRPETIFTAFNDGGTDGRKQVPRTATGDTHRPPKVTPVSVQRQLKNSGATALHGRYMEVRA